MPTLPRRSFLKHSAGFAATAASLHLTSGVRAQSPNSKFTVGLIGPGGMGTGHLRQLAKTDDVNFAYVCDVDQTRLAAAVKNVEAAGRRAPKAVGDFRRILEDKSVDAVFIATPDHWHAPATILACDAGKHVYVEKPGSHNIREGRLMIEAARRTKRVVQVGTQTRSSAHMIEGTAKVRSGAIGEVLACRVWNSQLRRNIGKAQPAPPPAHLDFDTWIGPAPMVPYKSTLLHGIWRWQFAFGAGDMGNDGVHDLDVGLWGLNVGLRHPSRVAALGGKYFFDDDQQFPDTQTVIFEWDLGGGKRKQLIYEPVESGKGSPDLAAHHRNFFDCVKSGKRPNADVEIHHYSACLVHLGNIATRLGRTLSFHSSKEEFIGDPEANALVRRQYRKEGHWAIPKMS